MTTTRFAPSPTGLLHLGSAYSALFAAQAAREAGGRFLVRMEDTDKARCRPEYDSAILEDLAWLGLAWENPIRRQSEHFDDYRAVIDRLDALGVLYPCFCSRKEIAAEIAQAGVAPHGPSGIVYPGTCRTLSKDERAERIATGQPYAIRLDCARGLAVTGPLYWHDRVAGRIAAQPEIEGDPIIARRDIPASYHLTVTIDDHLQGVTLVTRGEDLFTATHIHRLLQGLLGYDVPAYHHHKVLLDSSGARLSKRDQAVGIRALREAGRSAAAVRAMVGF